MGSWYIDRSRNIQSVFSEKKFELIVKNYKYINSKDIETNELIDLLQIEGKNPNAYLTYLRDIGFITIDNKISDKLCACIEGGLNQKDIIKIILLSRNDEKNQKSSTKPFVLIAKTIFYKRELGYKEELSWNDCAKYLMNVTSYEQIDKELINIMENDITTADDNRSVLDIWFNALLASGIFIGDSRKIILNDEYRDYIYFVARYGDFMRTSLTRDENLSQLCMCKYGLYELISKFSLESIKYLGDYEWIYKYCKKAFNYIRDYNDDVNNNKVGFNKIFYGIPGCGKSYKVASMLDYKDGFREEAIKNGINSKVDRENIIRTTFYLDYSNSDFVGQIYPVVDDEGNVAYESIPGPFTKALVRAYTHPDEMIYLVIEEINRGNAAAIFGDLFQLLDRTKDTKDWKYKGESEYPISNEFIEGYLKKILNGKIEINGNKDHLDFISNHNIIIPNNLTIFATMNTSDQNVFPLDTAFKRRWNLERVNTDWEKDENGKYKLSILNKCIPFTDMTWGKFASSVNVKMIDNCKDGIITQDKNLGPFFISEDILVESKDRYNPNHEEKIIQFVNNVIDYLFLDVTKFDHDVLFEKNIKYDEIYDYFYSLSHIEIDNIEEAKRYLEILGNNIEDDIDDELSKKTEVVNNGDIEQS